MPEWSWLNFANSHLHKTLPYPSKSFSGQTIIVTGANTGLGLEAARHFVRLDAAKVILAVRTPSKGEAAAASIEQSMGKSGVAEVWQLDLCSNDSIIRFAERVDKELDEVHVVVENAGVLYYDFQTAEGDEMNIKVNVVSTLMLGLLLLPKLRSTALKTGKKTVLTFVASWMHNVTSFEERKSDNVFELLATKKGARMQDRYPVSKLMELLLVRELSSQLHLSSKPGSTQLIVSASNPGAATTDVVRNSGWGTRMFAKFLSKVFMRTTEEGARTLVHSAEGEEETDGQYLDDCEVSPPSTFVRSEEGAQIQKKVWKELAEKLEKVKPGIMQNI